jgi:hypothetical protein
MNLKTLILIAVPALLIGCNTNSTDENKTSSIIAVENPTGDEDLIKTNSNNVNAEQTGPTTTIKYDEEVFDFGEVIYPSENKHTFRFKNTGNEPLTIISAKASCGCTIPKKPEEPVMPGEYGELEVVFKPKQGQQGQRVTKRVTVIANTVPKETYINIIADVLQGFDSALKDAQKVETREISTTIPANM